MADIGRLIRTTSEASLADTFFTASGDTLVAPAK